MKYVRSVIDSRLRLDFFTLTLAALGLFGTTLILLRVSHGAVVGSVDGRYYIQLARVLSEGLPGIDWVLGQSPHLVWKDYSLWHGPLHISQETSASWPPLYSLMLAVGGGFAIDAGEIAGPFNAIAFGVTVFFAGRWMLLHVCSKPLVVLGCAAVVFAVTPSYWATWAYTESTFILFATAALFHFDKFIASEERSALIWAAILTALACLTRYSGVVLILAVVPLLTLWRGSDLTRKLKCLSLYLAVSATPLALWLLRNYLVTETLTGSRESQYYGDFVTQVGNGMSSLEAWNPLFVDVRALLIPVELHTGRIIGAGIATLALSALVVLTLVGLLRWLRGEEASGSKIASLTVAGAYTFCHVAFTVASALPSYLSLTARQLIPVYVPLIVVCVIALDALVRNRDKLLIPEPLNKMPLIASPNLGRILSTTVVTTFAICVCYAGFVSIRDTHTMLLYPEVGWNASEFNARSVSIEPTSLLTEYLRSLVGDADPVDSDYFDLYIDDRALIYFRDDCNEQDMERRVRLRIEPASRLDLIGFRKSSGLNRLDFYPLRQGVTLDGKCLMVAPLPQYRIENIITGQSNNDGTELWQTAFSPSSAQTPK